MTEKRLQKFVFILTGFLFLMSGIDFLNQGKILFGVIQIFAGISNLILLKFKSDNAKINGNFAIWIFNILAAISVAVDYFQSGKQYIQYAWILVAVISFVGLIVQIKRAKRKKIPVK